ncbi:MAG: autotransporter-associated beta strand repeat-containing protein [bacterium]|nr:autotransporter-associated beta strand repeat-containing protein [bacterium]
MRRIVVSAGLLAMVCCGETVTIAPGNGVYTNVRERISGTVDVSVNPGASGGGIVRLNPANGYIGKTTLGSGTLLVDSLAPVGGNSSVGQDGMVQIGAGTFRYAGPDGAFTDRPFTNVLSASQVAIYDISNEVSIAGGVTKANGSFVKTGPGTLHLLGNNVFNGSGLADSTSGIQAKFVPKANGDSPDKGYRHFHVLEGTLVLGEDGGTTTIADGNNIGVGGWTTDSGQEVEATLEVRGGYVKWNNWIMHASYNGNTSNTSDHRPRSTVRVLDGILSGGTQTTVGGTFAMGRNKLGYSKFAQNSEPHLEVLGGQFLCSDLSVSDDRGAHSVVQIRNGGKVTANNCYTSRISGNADTTVTLDVSNGGTLIVNDITNQGGDNWNFAVTNGGILQCNQIKNTSGTFRLLFDGATVQTRGTGTYAVFQDSLASVKVGPKGVTVGANTVFRDQKGIASASADEPDAAGVTISNIKDGGVVEYCVPTSYNGPTTITYGYLSFLGTGALPPNSPLIMKAGGLQLTNGVVSVANATFGEAGTAAQLKLRVARGSHFVVTDSFTLADDPSEFIVRIYETPGVADGLTTSGTYPLVEAPLAAKGGLETLAAKARLALPENPDSVAFEVVEANGHAVLQAAVVLPVQVPQSADTWSNGAGDGLWATDGNWTSGAAVNQAGRTAMFPNVGEDPQTVSLGTDGAFTAGGLDFTATTTDYTVSGGTLTLANGAAGAAIKSVGGRSHVVASTLAGSSPVTVNPAASGAGQVTLADVSSSFTGGLKTGSGTTELGSLAFVKSAADLVVGPGTLKYTGAGETVPGLTFDAGASLAAVLDVAHDLKVDSVALGTSALLKTGAGTLTLGGTGAYALANTSKNADKKAGIGVYGDSPVDAIQQLSVADGRLVVGVADDPANAPSVSVGGEVDVGMRTASAANGRRETAGEFVMNNGTFSCNIFELGYYCGTATTVGTDPADRLVQRFTMNGGAFNAASTISSLWDWGYEQHNMEAIFDIRGGVVTTGQLRLNSMPGMGDLKTVWNQTDGRVKATSMLVGQYAAAGKTHGPLEMNLDGGELMISGTCTFSNSVPVDINVNPDAVFGTGTLSAFGNTANAARIHFRGGRYRGYAPGNSNTEWRNHTGYAVYLSDDLVYDTSADLGVGAVRRVWSYINHKVEVEPGSERSDYGITFVGGGQVAVGPAFNASTVTGPIRFTDRTSAVPLTTAFRNHAVEIATDSVLRQYNLYAEFKDLTLGTADASAPAYVDLHTSYAKTNEAVIVTGTLNVAGPVAFITHSDNQNTERQHAAGTYTALVYQASQTFDTSKVVPAPFKDAKAYTVAEVILPDSDKRHPGWKALVVTISSTAAGVTDPTARFWSAVQTGGDWSVAANWNGHDAPATEGEEGVFAPATAAAVPVRIDAPVTSGSLTLDGSVAANGYRLSGAPLTVRNPDGHSASIYASSGTHEIAAPLVLPQRTMLDTKSGAKLKVDDLTSSNATVTVNLRQYTGGGEVELVKTEGIATLAVRSGRTIVDDLSFATKNNSVQVGPGTLDYRGTGETIPGIYLNEGSGGSKCSVLRIEKDLGIKEMTYGSEAVTKTGPGDLFFRGTGTIKFGSTSWNRGSQADTYVRANGDGPVATYRRGNVSEGRIVQGTVNDPTDAPTVTCTDFCVGVDHVEGKDCEYVLNNGVLDVTGSMYIDYYHGVTKNCRGKFTMNGGRLKGSWIRMLQSGNATMYADPEFEINGGTATFTGDIMMGYQTMKTTGNTATLRVNGGSLSIGGTLYAVSLSSSSTGADNTTTDGEIEINGGELFCSNSVQMCRAAANKAKLNLNGGVLAAKNVTTTRGKSYMTFNGGAFRPTAANELKGLTAVYVSTNGATISTALLPDDAVYTISQNLVADPLLGSAVDGGFTKLGKGTLVLSGANTFSGPTRIALGTLRATRDEALSDRIELATAGTLDMAGRTLSVGEIICQGVAQNGSLKVGGALLKNSDDDGALNVVGDLAVDTKAVVDFGLTAADELAFNQRIPLATFTGVCTAPARLKTRNGANVPAVRLETKDNVLWAVTTSGGTMIFVR